MNIYAISDLEGLYPQQVLPIYEEIKKEKENKKLIICGDVIDSTIAGNEIYKEEEFLNSSLENKEVNNENKNEFNKNNNNKIDIFEDLDLGSPPKIFDNYKKISFDIYPKSSKTIVENYIKDHKIENDDRMLKKINKYSQKNISDSNKISKLNYNNSNSNNNSKSNSNSNSIKNNNNNTINDLISPNFFYEKNKNKNK